MRSTRRTYALVGFVLIGVFLLNYSLFALGQTLGPLPWGLSRPQAPNDILYYVTDDVGKPPPANGKEIPIEQFSDIEGVFWSGAPNSEWADDPYAHKAATAWLHDWLSDPSYYGTPKGTAFDLWNTKRADLKAMGINSEQELLTIFQTNPQRSQEICLKFGGSAVYYITKSGGGTTRVTTGVLPVSNFWDLRVFSKGVGGLLMGGANPDWIIDSLRKQGFTDQYIGAAFEQALAAHGTSMSIDLDFHRGGNIPDEWWGKTGEGLQAKYTAPSIRTIREPSWMQITPQMLEDRGGVIWVPDGKGGWRKVTEPTLLIIPGNVPVEFFTKNKLDIGVMKGGRDLYTVLVGDFLNYLLEKKPALYDKLSKSPTMAVPADVYMAYVDWCKMTHQEYLAVPFSSIVPSAKLKEILGDKYYLCAPSPTTAQLELYMRNDPTALMVFDEAKKFYGKVTESFETAMEMAVDSLVQQGKLSPQQATEWKASVKKTYLDQAATFYKAYAESGGMTYWEMVDLTSMLRSMGMNDAADIIEAGWSKANETDWGTWLTGNTKNAPGSWELGATGEYTYKINGWTWNDAKQEWVPPKPPTTKVEGATTTKDGGTTDQDYASSIKSALDKSRAATGYAGGNDEVYKLSLLSVLSKEFSMSNLRGVRVPASASTSRVRLSNPKFTFALLSRNYERLPVARLQILSFAWAVSFGSFSVEIAWILTLAVALICLVKGWKG